MTTTTIQKTYTNPDHSQQAVEDAARDAVQALGSADITCISCHVSEVPVLDTGGVRVGTTYVYLSDWKVNEKPVTQQGQ